MPSPAAAEAPEAQALRLTQDALHAKAEAQRQRRRAIALMRQAEAICRRYGIKFEVVHKAASSTKDQERSHE